MFLVPRFCFFFFFNDTATTEIYTLSLHDALPIFDFSSNEGLLFSWSKHINADALVDTYRVIPGELLNAGFLMLMPFTLNIRKYVDMLKVLGDKDKLLNFLRMEKWIFDSPGQGCQRSI